MNPTPSADSAASPTKPRGPIRRFLPVVVLCLMAIVLTILAFWPGNQADESSLNMARMLTAIVGGTILLIWMLRSSGWPRGVRFGLLAVPVLLMSTVKVTSMQGEFSPIFRWRDWVMDLAFGGRHDTKLAKHRQEQGAFSGQARLADLPGDWPEYRGRNRDGIVRGVSLARDWEAVPPKLIWRQPVGGGYAAFSVANGFLVTIEQRGDDEVVACYDAATAKEAWTASWPTRFSETLGGPGPRATPTIHDGRVYAYGAKGKLACIDGETGTILWSVDTLDDNANIAWAMSGSPLIVDNLAIVNPGAQKDSASGKAVRAYDRLSGKEVWTGGSRQAGYASPQLATLDSVRQILIFDADGIAGHDIATGSELWRFRWPTYQGINVAQPLIVDDKTLCISSGYSSGGALIRVEKAAESWTVREVWRTKTTVMRSKFASTLKRGDYSYGLNDGILECVSLKDGKVAWKDDRKAKAGQAYGHGQLLLVDDRIVVLTEFGELVLVEANPDEFRELARIKALLAGSKTWNTPAMVGNRIYIRNEEEMACFELP
jgi:outer membrane protein assembly factor BamB